VISRQREGALCWDYSHRLGRCQSPDSPAACHNGAWAECGRADDV